MVRFFQLTDLVVVYYSVVEMLYTDYQEIVGIALGDVAGQRAFQEHIVVDVVAAVVQRSGCSWQRFKGKEARVLVLYVTVFRKQNGGKLYGGVAMLGLVTERQMRLRGYDRMRVCVGVFV